MRSSTWMLAVLLFAVPVISARADGGEYETSRNPREPGEWTVPDCERVMGSSAVTFTTDEGLTLAETRNLQGVLYTRGLVALDAGDTLLASALNTSGTSILRSEDAGCLWTQLAQLPENGLLLLTAGPGGVAYGWSRGRDTFYRIEADAVATLSAPQSIYGLAVDPADATHIRIGTAECQLYESLDGGASFAPLGGPANSDSITMFTVEFDPVEFDHALCGARGAYRTTDAGQSWSAIPPFDSEDADLVYVFEFSPAVPWRVWARANLDTVANRSNEILVSSDGGATFHTAIVEGEPAYDQNGIERTVMLSNQLTMAAHPVEPDLLYFTWTENFCCPHEILGENLCRYDALIDVPRVVYIDGLDGIGALEFNPADADLIYLGQESETVPGKKL